MEKCLITKLNGTINNDSILKLGELRLSFTSTGSSKELSIGLKESQKLSIIGNGYFTDASGLNLGKTIDTSVGGTTTTFHVSDGEFELSIPNKYKLSGLKVKNCSISDLAELKYSPLFEYFETTNFKISGDIANLSELKNLTNLGLSSTQVRGDIANLKNLTALNILGLSNTQVSGDIANLSELKNLTNLGLSSTQVRGDIASLAGMTGLNYVSLANTQVSGDIASLSELKNLTILFAGKNNHGDVAVLSPKLQFINMNKKSATWSTRPSSSTIIAMEDVDFGNNVDKMLQNQAQCVKPEIQDEQAWKRTIKVIGTRTSVSDSAVAVLQGKGYTIIVNPA